MDINITEQLNSVLRTAGLSADYLTPVVSVIFFTAVLILAWASYFILSRIVLHCMRKVTKKTHSSWDDILFNQTVFRRISHLFPAVIIYFGAPLALPGYESAVSVIQRAAYLYMCAAGILMIDAVINALHEIYTTLPAAKNRSIKGYVQVVKIFIYIIGAGLFFSILLNRDFSTFFAGLGAMAAVLMLVFKDSIMGLVAGVQLSANNMVQLGDWISMPSRGADGDVIDISLNTVKVNNWDKTISTIPTYALVSESFTNWRGMQESGGRRIMRSVSIDMKSIHFLSREEIDRFKKIHILREYLDTREREIEQYNRENSADETMPVNGRRLTNIGTFRRYLVEYLRRHPMIHQDMTFLVRQLDPTDKGLPVQVYVFCKDQRWVEYEGIQSDIFDHILAVIPQFGLRVYQSPSGDDIATLADRLKQQ